jgi:2-polyprenyl-6-methoxyphenol hydroxylase-like FAD-dependent oxidoreductase
MTPNSEPDVLVVGAGPTGLTLAGQLLALGAAVRIVDRQLDRVHESRALAVQPRTLEVLRGLGLAETLVERGNDTSRLQVHAGERVVAVRLFDVGLEDTAYPFLLFISQAETEAVLNEHLAEQGAQVERGVELVEFQAGEEAVRCMLRQGHERTERLQARYLVGCDGAHSSVRHGAGIPFEGGAYPQTFVLGDLEVDGDLASDVGHAARYRAGRVFLAGDAAHVHSPAGAQGMNTGIQEAWNLGWKLAIVARGIADEALLESYEIERQPIGRFVLRFTDRAARIATSESRGLRLLRTELVPRLAPLVLRSSRARAYGFRTVSQLRINYRRSPAVREGEPTLKRGPKAGDRLPDARIAHDGQPGWLLDAVAGPSFQLLLCGRADGWDEKYSALCSSATAASSPCADWSATPHRARSTISTGRRSLASASTARRST